MNQIAIIGAGWAGCAAAVQAASQGQRVTLFEATRTAGGRARRIPHHLYGPLDNGQHILLGAYTHTLNLMRQVGIDLERALHRLPLTLRRPDGSGIALNGSRPTPRSLLMAILGARHWPWLDKINLLLAARRWQGMHFQCPHQQCVADLCRDLRPHVIEHFIAPLCVAALNTPMSRACAQTFLHVLRDGLWGTNANCDLLLPRIDLSALFPEAALAWLEQHQGQVRLGQRVHSLQPIEQATQTVWQVNDEIFEHVILACSPWQACQLAQQAGPTAQSWVQQTQALTFEAITTVYAMVPGARLAQPMLVLPSTNHAHTWAAPAQFVFDRGQLGGPPGLLAFVISASPQGSDSALLEQQVLAQGQYQLGLGPLDPVQTVVEKRATFSCTPALQRPGMHIAPGLLACGDYIAGPYPATLEGATRSGQQAAWATKIA